MKKLLLWMFLVCVSFTSHAQDAIIQDIKEINFYGVDFSKVKALGVSENPLSIKTALYQINPLFISESKKYNIKKYFKKKVLANTFDIVQRRNANMDESKLIVDNPQEITQEEIQKIIQSLSYGDNNKTGLIFIAESLDKFKLCATYHVVFFDEATKKVIYSSKSVGNAQGFGIRNFWARSVYNIIRNWKY